MKTSERIQSFGIYLQHKGYSASLLNNYRYALTTILTVLEEVPVTLDGIEVCLEMLKGKGYKATGLKHYKSCLKLYCSFLVHEGMLQKNPFDEGDIHIRVTPFFSTKRLLKRQLTDGQQKLLQQYKNYLSTASRSSTVQKEYPKHIEAFIDYCNTQGKEVLTLTVDGVTQYRNYLVNEKSELARRTVNAYLESISSFYRWCVKTGKVGGNPVIPEQYLKKGIVIPRAILGIEEMGKLLTSIPVTTPEHIVYKTVIELMYGSGIRISEVYSLTCDDIDLMRRVMTITEVKNGNKRRMVPIGEVSTRWLRRYLKEVRAQVMKHPSPYVFPQQEWVARGINRLLQEQCRKLRYRELTSHSLRHCCATHLLKKGAGIREVQAYLGHSKIKATEVYTRVVKEDLKKVVEKYHPRCEGEYHERTFVGTRTGVV